MKYYLLIGMTLTIVAIWIFYKKPILEKFNYSVTFPWRVEDRNILDCNIVINSDNSELYVNDKIFFKVKLSNYNFDFQLYMFLKQKSPDLKTDELHKQYTQHFYCIFVVNIFEFQ